VIIGNRSRRTRVIWAGAAGIVILVAATVVGVTRSDDNGLGLSADGAASSASSAQHSASSSSSSRTASPSQLAPVPPTIAPPSSATASTTAAPSSTAQSAAAAAAAAPRKAGPASTTARAAAAPPAANGNTLFSDSFSGSALSSAWTVISRHGEYAQNETECNTAGQVGVASNTLTITTVAAATTCGDANNAPSSWPYATGDVQWRSLNFTYGTISIVGKFPAKNTSTWPAFWLLGSNCQQSNPLTGDTGVDGCPGLGTANYTEIDMVECYNNDWCQLALAQPNGSFPVCEFSPQTDTNWHTFTTVWTATAITSFVDGKSTGCSFTAAGGYKIPSTPMFLIIQTQTGGVSGTPANLPATLQVKSVTVTK
jgi:Glycosyl hydrolases family 16